VTSTPPLGLGFVGAGRFAAFVASAATGLPEVGVGAVTDPDTARARRPADAHGAALVPDVATLLRDDRVRAVVIAAPPNTHAPVTPQALAAGRHVLRAKPVALTETDADAVRDAVVASDWPSSSTTSCAKTRYWPRSVGCAKPASSARYIGWPSRTTPPTRTFTPATGSGTRPSAADSCSNTGVSTRSPLREAP
jgi:Oxidoreductase family, NAD-binding Rossmann fold